MPDHLSLLDLISIAAAAVELLVAAVWRMPAAVVADIASVFGQSPAFSFLGA
ncbi:hypothetical protein [Methylobacterium nodulans]|uniref:Uncharacterized protein n=1 Tax=Methylobacterium nodulans (strain LMG 21967 / CNCM I-2342 / ORS 2060) TaxID=460265 RepID=B8IRH1_METNO|nr:hypothetical protein [Methylobacterium nodulans]ACL58711.1 hypothetical protein Mnod_3811 [Methylobacterium nodulans ORS 2060]